MANSLVPAPSWEVRLVLRFVREPLVTELGEAQADAVLAAFYEELPRALAQVPALSPGLSEGRQLLMGTAYILAFYRAMKRHGYPVALSARLVREGYRLGMEKVPGPLRRLYGWWWFRPSVYTRLVSKMLGRGPNDFQGELLVGGRDFDFGVDYTQCAIQRFLIAVEAAELAPYICQIDDIQSEVFGLGLVRTQTLAQGGTRCDFRWKRGRGGR